MTTTAPSPGSELDTGPGVAILDVAAELLGEGGFDGLQLRDVAARARVSLSTIYRLYPSRDELVVAAVERWMAAEVYRPLKTAPTDQSLDDLLIRTFRRVFEPWRRNPTMLSVFLRAALLPGGERLSNQGADAVSRGAAAAFAAYDPAVVRDITTILEHVTSGLLSRFANGAIGVTEIVRVYELAVRRLTVGVEPLVSRER